MEKNTPLPMTPFDTFVTSPQLQTMKLLLPYLPATYQRMFGFYIKFTELKNTLHYFSYLHTNSKNGFLKNSNISPLAMLEEMRPYMSQKDSESIESLLSMLSMVDMMNMMNGTDMPDLSNLGDMSGMMDMMNMMNMFHSDSQDDQKGNDNDDNK